MKQNNLSPSKSAAAKTIQEAFKVLLEEGGQLPAKDITDKLSQRLQFTDWEKGILEKTGNIRWKSIFQFYTVDCIKAGYLRKDNGIWYVTPEGEEAFKKFGPVEFLESANDAYKKWKIENNKIEIKQLNDEPEIVDHIEEIQQINILQLEEQAIAGIKDFITQKTAYEFQDLIAALLRSMGYYTPFVAPKGKDGGIDIVAYQDPLGIKIPRLKVQVKHYPQNPIGPEPIRSLKGLINDEDMGLFVTSGRFTPEAQRFAREANVHIKLVDGEEFISLWRQFYDKMTDEDKIFLPLHPIYFLGSNE
jgi:restriction system protein